MQSDKIIICGSGASVPFSSEQFKQTGSGLAPLLQRVIGENYSIGLNSWYKFGCATTINFVNDFAFYHKNHASLKDLRLVIARHNTQLYNQKYPLHENTLVLPDAKYYFGVNSWDIHNKKCLLCDYKVHRTEHNVRNCPTHRSRLWPIGFYHGHLAGIISTTLAIALGFKKIYWLGLDCNLTEGKTHFYQDLITDFREYFGVGVKEGPRGTTFNTSAYSCLQKLNDRYYSPLAEDQSVKIYNVSPGSALNGFQKIDYNQFYYDFEKSSIDPNVAPDEVRDFIIEKTK